MSRITRRTALGLLAAPLIARPAVAAGAQASLSVAGKLNANPRVFAFGGGVWRVPKVMRLAEPVLDALGTGGCTRAALAWEVLAKAQSAEQAARILNAYPLNGYLAGRAKAGGTVIITLDATPLHLAADRSTKKLADGPAWAKSPIASEQGWAEMTAVIVRHFRALGINAYYEVWNEPDHALRGSVKDYLRLYRATVAGARQADRNARIMGPAVSDWTAVTPDGRFAARFFEGAKQMGLPIHAVSYHSFNRVPANHHARVMADIRALARRTGMKMPAVYNTEWNIAAEPPYPEGDLNGEFPGAAHVGASLIGMAKAGLTGQVFQMMVDPGANGYHAGVLSVAGTPRAAYHAFALARPMTAGGLRDVTSNSPAVTAVASARGGKLNVLVATFPPTDLMLIRDAMEDVALSDPALFRALSKLPPNRMLSFFKGNGGNPAQGGGAQALDAGRARYRAALNAREAWRHGGSFALTLPRPMRMESHQVIDKSTAPGGGQIRAADAKTKSQLESALRALTPKLRGLGVAEAPVRQYGAELAERVDGRQALSTAKGQLKTQLQGLDQQWARPLQQRISAIARQQAKRLYAPVPKGATQTHNIQTQPYALHLLTFV